MINRNQEVYTAADLTALIGCLSKLGFDTGELDLILADQHRLGALRRILSEVPDPINPSHTPELFKAMLLTFSRNFELFEAMKEKTMENKE